MCKQVDFRLLPVFLPVLLSAAFLRRKTALAYGVFLSLLTALAMAPTEDFIFNSLVLRTSIASILGSAAAVLILRKKQHRGEYILAGLIAGGITGTVYIAFGILEGLALYQYFTALGFGIAGGLICGLLAVGILPIWETLFSLATPSKLLELSNPSNELLKRLMIEAPGTYHHSVMVGNLAEAAADVVGADALLARVAAYYHDIGKLVNPLMFKENQIHMKNPHDELSPKDSAKIIIEHVAMGKELAERYKLPKRVRDIIMQHHGDSLATYFYYMAKQQGEAEERDFRYAGPKPNSREAAIVMLADVVEAAVRANLGVMKESLKVQVTKLVRAKYEDGQLDDCTLNNRDLTRIIEAFLYVFEGANHERIVYPEQEEKEEANPIE